ncbi:MAG: FecR domain-containing protein [Myxococcaceae bacterium]|nr:FecR domain-containing protein [Myxococcaceae bacterium]
MIAVRTVSTAAFAALILSGATPAFADGVGKFAEIAGTDVKRTAADGSVAKARVGDEIALDDTITTGKGTRVKIQLNDESVIALDENSTLHIDEATFGEQTRFSATLSVGRFWSKVKKFVAGGDAKFEVKTDRAVAGVRGTVFRIDAVALARSTRPKTTTVWVSEGKVAVDATVKPSTAQSTCAPKKGQKGPRTQVPGPKEISKDEWEKRFAELQQGMSVTVGEELWCVEPKPEPKDAFAKFVAQ